MLFVFDQNDPRAAYQQIVAAIKQQVQAGRLAPSDELPSVRELAADLGINLHTARHAYQVLSQEGIIHLRLGRRARIAALRRAPAMPEQIESRIASRLRDLITDAFHLGVSGNEFRKLVEQVLKTAPGNAGQRNAKE